MNIGNFYAQYAYIYIRKLVANISLCLGFYVIPYTWLRAPMIMQSAAYGLLPRSMLLAFLLILFSLGGILFEDTL